MKIKDNIAWVIRLFSKMKFVYVYKHADMSKDFIYKRNNILSWVWIFIIFPIIFLSIWVFFLLWVDLVYGIVSSLMNIWKIYKEICLERFKNLRDITDYSKKE
jgi:hypothetical protein